MNTAYKKAFPKTVFTPKTYAEFNSYNKRGALNRCSRSFRRTKRNSYFGTLWGDDISRRAALAAAAAAAALRGRHGATSSFRTLNVEL